MAYEQIYEDVDLSKYGLDATMRVLVNPTRKFRKEFWARCLSGAGDAWADSVRIILGGDPDVADNLDPIVLHRLLVPHIADDGKPILPAIFDIWDTYVDVRVKALAVRP